MKFLADMGIARSVVLWLNEQGHDTVHVRDHDPRATDSWICDLARDQDRIVLTLDLDFGDILSAAGAGGPSVVLFRLRRPRPEIVKRQLEQVLATAETPLAEGAIVIVEESKIRTRRLPIADRP